MALNKKLAPYYNRHINGDYDNRLRTLPLLTAVPALALVAIDLHRYMKNSKLHHVQNRSSLILDAIVLAFLSLNVIWALAWNKIHRYREVKPRAWIFCVDFLLLTAMLSLGDTTLSMRSSSQKCAEILGECSGTALSIMTALGALLIITSVPQHVLCAGACKRHLHLRRKNKSIRREMNSTDEGPALTFGNEIK